VPRFYLLGQSADAAAIVARGNGGLVCRVFGDAVFLEEIVQASRASRPALPRHRIEMSPGRNGDAAARARRPGARAAARSWRARGLALYMQRVALEGSRR